MRFKMLWMVSLLLPMVLLRVLLESLISESTAAFLAAGLAIACNLLWTEHCRIWEKFDTDRVMEAALLAYGLILYSVGSTISQLLVNVGATATQQKLAYPIVFVAVIVVLFTIALLLCRLSFSAAEMRDVHRRRGQRQTRTIVE